MTTPAAIDVQTFDILIGNDGPWSAFNISVGTPPQVLTILPSTLSTQTWVVAPTGCGRGSFLNCRDLRGGLFTDDDSLTWDQIASGTFNLGLEGNLLSGNENTRTGVFGLDTVSLSRTTGENVGVENSVVGAMNTNDFYVGLLGLNSKAPSLPNQTRPSFLTSLRDDERIPSLSWSYTAGTKYNNRPASLVLGGQDTGQFEGTSTNFTMAPGNDFERDLTVRVKSVVSKGDGDDRNLLTDEIPVFIDSTLPNIWIPSDDCQAWEEAFGLEYDDRTLMYLIPEDTHSSNLEINPNITFTIADYSGNGATTDITIPYAAFALEYLNPRGSNTEPVLYFPLRRAANADQQVFGRAFLQGAYLSVNYEWQNFSVFQALVEPGERHIVNLPTYSDEAAQTEAESPNSGTIGSSSGSDQNNDDSDADGGGDGGGGGGISGGAIGGIVVGVIAIIAIIGAIFWWRRRKARKNRDLQASPMPPTPSMPNASEMAAVEKQPQDYFSPHSGTKGVTVAGKPSELPSPPPDTASGVVGTPPDVHHQQPYAHELAGSMTMHELAGHTSANMMNGPSPSLNPAMVPNDDIGGSSSRDYAQHTHSASVQSAASIPIATAGRAQMVNHSRAGSISPGQPTTPMTPTQLGPPAHERGESSGLQRGGSKHSQTSEGTLVNPGPSPMISATSPTRIESSMAPFVSPEIEARSSGRHESDRERIAREERQGMLYDDSEDSRRLG